MRPPLSPAHAERIAYEAAMFQSNCSARLSKRPNALLHRLASMIQQKPKKELPLTLAALANRPFAN